MRSKGACNPAKEQLATGGRLCCPPLAPVRQQQLQTMQDNPETRAKLARLAHMHACIAAYTNTSAHAYTRTRVCVPWRKTPGKWHSRPPSCPVAAPCCGRPRSPWTPAASAKATPVVITARNQLACPHTSVPARPNTRSAPLRMNTHNIAPSRWRLSPPCWRACCSQTQDCGVMAPEGAHVDSISGPPAHAVHPSASHAITHAPGAEAFESQSSHCLRSSRPAPFLQLAMHGHRTRVLLSSSAAAVGAHAHLCAAASSGQDMSTLHAHFAASMPEQNPH